MTPAASASGNRPTRTAPTPRIIEAFGQCTSDDAVLRDERDLGVVEVDRVRERHVRPEHAEVRQVLDRPPAVQAHRDLDLGRVPRLVHDQRHAPVVGEALRGHHEFVGVGEHPREQHGRSDPPARSRQERIAIDLVLEPAQPLLGRHPQRRERVRRVDDEPAGQPAHADGLDRAGGLVEEHRAAGVRVDRRPARDHLHAREHRARVLQLGRHAGERLDLDRRPIRRVLRDQAARRARIRVVVAVDESRVDERAAEVADAPCAGGMRNADHAVRPDRHDPPARDRDRAVDQDPPLGVEREDAAVAQQQIDLDHSPTSPRRQVAAPAAPDGAADERRPDRDRPATSCAVRTKVSTAGDDPETDHTTRIGATASASVRGR